MRSELIHIGTELLSGQVLNTHQQWLGEQLARLGHPPLRATVVPDHPRAIGEILDRALSRSDLAVATGGLGPTGDDRTLEVLARLLDRPLEEDPEVRKSIGEYFADRGLAPPPKAYRQALVPRGAAVFPNRHGTAPGLGLRPLREGRRRALALLPGPPRELRPMFLEEALPWLRAGGVLPPGRIHSLVLRTAGMGESLVEERLRPLAAPELEIGYCARPGCVDVRLTSLREELVGEAARQARERLGEAVYGEGDLSLEEAAVGELARAGLTLATAESCTGGFIAHSLTNVPGSSRVLDSGWVTYSDGSKVRLPGVDPGDLAKHGAVSGPVARQMAEGARRSAGTDLALSATGIAGPGGGSARKPAGTVFLALAGARGTLLRQGLYPMERTGFKRRVLAEALLMLLQEARRTGT